MKVVLLRVGIDTNAGGIYGPLFKNGDFEYIPIPDPDTEVRRTYGNTKGRTGRAFIDFFPETDREKMQRCRMHFDPEFDTFTYGDPTSPKAGLRRLEPGDLLVFYCGLEGWDFSSEPALYLMGFFEVDTSGLASEFSAQEIGTLFGNNAHVRDRDRILNEYERLVLVKGTSSSRLLKKAQKISTYGKNRAGSPIKVLSDEAQKIFGHFDGKIAIQRSPPRWVAPEFVSTAADFVTSLE